jgi:hypothetical protein
VFGRGGEKPEFHRAGISGGAAPSGVR